MGGRVRSGEDVERLLGFEHIAPIAERVVANAAERAAEGLPPSAYCPGCGAKHETDVGEHFCNHCQRRQALARHQAFRDEMSRGRSRKGRC